jgi:hypothetical protein
MRDLRGCLELLYSTAWSRSLLKERDGTCLSAQTRKHEQGVKVKKTSEEE